MDHVIYDKRKLLVQVHRIQGQLNGLERCLLEDRDYGVTLQMATACRGRLNALILSIIEGSIRYHVARPDESPVREKFAVQEVMAIIKSYLK